MRTMRKLHTKNFHVHCTRILHVLVWVFSSCSHSKVTLRNICHNARECARLSAQRRRYEAVFEMAPRQYSIVWIAW